MMINYGAAHAHADASTLSQQCLQLLLAMWLSRWALVHPGAIRAAKKHDRRHEMW